MATSISCAGRHRNGDGDNCGGDGFSLVLAGGDVCCLIVMVVVMKVMVVAMVKTGGVVAMVKTGGDVAMVLMMVVVVLSDTGN